MSITVYSASYSTAVKEFNMNITAYSDSYSTAVHDLATQEKQRHVLAQVQESTKFDAPLVDLIGQYAFPQIHPAVQQNRPGATMQQPAPIQSLSTNVRVSMAVMPFFQQT